jgi:alcohol dehydrogenase class IV
MESGSEFGARQMAGFKDFFQAVQQTRVVAGSRPATTRVFVVTDAVIRGTGLIEKVEAGVADGGLEVAGVFDDVPQDSSTAVCERCAEEAKAAGADSFLAVGGGSVMDTAKVANVVFSHGGRSVDYEGLYLLPRADDGMGAPLPVAPLACRRARAPRSRWARWSRTTSRR